MVVLAKNGLINTIIKNEFRTKVHRLKGDLFDQITYQVTIHNIWYDGNMVWLLTFTFKIMLSCYLTLYISN